MIIEKELICVDVEAQDKMGMINHLITVAHHHHKLNDCDEYRDAVMHRENEFSTALGYLVAIPHGQSNAVNEPFVVFGRCRQEVQWDDHLVKLVFLIGVPLQNRETVHMKVLANISRKLIDDQFREDLRLAKDEDEIFKILSTITI